MKNLFKKMTILSIAMLVFGCSKDGATGATGANGINGANGANGTNGNANVYGTNSFPVTSGNWTASSANTQWITVLNVPQITQAIVDKGTVSVFWYISNTSGSGWYALPISFGNVSVSYAMTLGQVGIIYASSGGAITNPSGQTYRVVVISASNKIAHPNTNWNNYEEVKSVLKLRD